MSHNHGTGSGDLWAYWTASRRVSSAPSTARSRRPSARGCSPSRSPRPCGARLDTKAAVVSRDRILVPNTVHGAPVADRRRAHGRRSARRSSTSSTDLVQKHATASATPVRRRHLDRAPVATPSLSDGHGAGRLAQREGPGRLDAGARRRRQALPDPQGPHGHRPRQRRRRHARRLRHLREHVEILWDGKRALVRDLGSTNGTLLERRTGERGRARARLGRSPSAAPASCSACSRRLGARRRPRGRPAPPSATTWAGSGGPANERTHPPAPALGFLLLLWVFVFADRLLAAQRPVRREVRRMPQPDAAAARPCAGGRVPVAAARRHPRTRRGRRAPAAPASGPGGETATTETATRLVITSGPKAGARVPARQRAAHHRPLQRIGDSSSATTTPPATTRASCCGTTSG